MKKKLKMADGCYQFNMHINDYLANRQRKIANGG
jgi:hypothetical protein